ncbi:hypothetical protein [Streptomyces sp. NPDC059979]|uniref:hypothetical protein n=1 Tax=Streptomyces sp. NPDC059979 TaxID=3347021 RepID=UPI0036BA597A
MEQLEPDQARHPLRITSQPPWEVGARTSVTLLVCDRLKLSPVPFRLAGLFANVGGTARSSVTRPTSSSRAGLA